MTLAWIDARLWRVCSNCRAAIKVATLEELGPTRDLCPGCMEEEHA